MEFIQSSVAKSLADTVPTTVAGVSATQVHVPDSGYELASLLEAANREGLTVAPVGGGTHLAIGNAPTRLDWIISTRNLNRVLAYESPDMTLSVEGGSRFGDVQRLLAEKGQGLPIEVSDPDTATIGGIVASALYGPKRLGSGTLRDYLIGINVAYPDGTLAKAGGMVVKNVSGFDLMRMHHGALGTLGVIVSANFKVLPRPRSERTVLISASGVKEVERQKRAFETSRARPGAFEIIRMPDHFVLAIRIEGRERTSALLSGEVAAMLGEDARILEAAESERYWSGYASAFRTSEDGAECWLRLRVKPGDTLEMLERVQVALDGLGVSAARLTASAGLGFIDLRQTCESSAELQRIVAVMRSMVPRTVVVSAPAALKSGIDVWGDSIESLDLMRLLKAELDPNCVLNPGRYVGGL